MGADGATRAPASSRRRTSIGPRATLAETSRSRTTRRRNTRREVCGLVRPQTSPEGQRSTYGAAVRRHQFEEINEGQARQQYPRVAALTARSDSVRLDARSVPALGEHSGRNASASAERSAARSPELSLGGRVVRRERKVLQELLATRSRVTRRGGGGLGRGA